MPEGIRLLAGGLVLTGSRLNRVKCVCKVACLGFGLRWVGGWVEGGNVGRRGNLKAKLLHTFPSKYWNGNREYLCFSAR